MMKPTLSEDALEDLLRMIELPGENSEDLRRYLESAHFVERVMGQVRIEAERNQKVTAWALFALINLILLLIVGSNRYIVGSYFAMQETLSQFFFLFLGISFLGALFGLVLSSDTTWVESLPQVLQPFYALRRLLVRNGQPK
jgi:hypothetical protein